MPPLFYVYKMHKKQLSTLYIIFPENFQNLLTLVMTYGII